MADVLAFNLTQAKSHADRKFKRPDLSTKLKLLGVEVASFGDFFADRDGPRDLPARRGGGAKSEGRAKSNGDVSPAPAVKALSYRDPFQAVYKKYLFTTDGKYLLGGMMIGDTKDYVKLVPMVKNQKPLDVPPSQFILGAKGGDDDNADDLYVETPSTFRSICPLTVIKGTTTHKYARVIMSPRETSRRSSRTVAARASEMSSHVQRPARDVVDVCLSSKPSSTRR